MRLARPNQWVKNGFVVAPLIFAGKFTDEAMLWRTALAIALLCAASSAIYVINDIFDRERDRTHPKKRKRPVASGKVPVGGAWALAALLLAAQGAGFVLGPAFVGVVGVFLLLNVAYTLRLKSVPVVDIFCIAGSFALRVQAGATAIDVPVSGWMFITTVCLALYLASIKRRQELKAHGDGGRAVLERYSVELVDRYAEMSATGALVFYSLFVLSAKPALLGTIPVVLYGLFRYWYIVEQTEQGESPTAALLGDWQLLLAVAGWFAYCVWALRPGAM